MNVSDSLPACSTARRWPASAESSAAPLPQDPARRLLHALEVPYPRHHHSKPPRERFEILRTAIERLPATVDQDEVYEILFQAVATRKSHEFLTQAWCRRRDRAVAKVRKAIEEFPTRPMTRASIVAWPSSSCRRLTRDETAKQRFLQEAQAAAPTAGSSSASASSGLNLTMPTETLGNLVRDFSSTLEVSSG